MDQSPEVLPMQPHHGNLHMWKLVKNAKSICPWQSHPRHENYTKCPAKASSHLHWQQQHRKMLGVHVYLVNHDKRIISWYMGENNGKPFLYATKKTTWEKIIP